MSLAILVGLLLILGSVIKVKGGEELNNTIRQVLAAIAIALLIVILSLVSLFLSVAIGYFIGYLLTILPFVSGWLTATLPISAAQIPAITAWMGVLAFFIRSISTVRSQIMED